MEARLRYPEVAPEGYAALQAFGHYVNTGTALEPVLLGLVYLRASVLNGCEFCTELHKAELRKHREPESRIAAVSEGPASDAFTPREQAALRWTEVLTQMGGGTASDEEYAVVGRFFQGKELVDLTFGIANINAWNRMGVAFRPAWRPRKPGVRGGEATVQASGDPATAEPVLVRGHDAAAEREDDGGKVGTD